jgi:hypothetical protein
MLLRWMLDDGGTANGAFAITQAANDNWLPRAIIG